MLLLPKQQPRVVEVPLLLMGLCGLFSLLTLLPQLARGSLDARATWQLVVTGGLAALLAVAVVLLWRTLEPVEDQLQVRSLLRSRSYILAGASLAYARSGNLSRPSYWLVLRLDSEESLQLIKLSRGMSLAKDIVRAERIAAAWELSLYVPPDLREAARVQESGPIAPRQIPWLVGGIALVVGVISVTASLLDNSATLRIICPGVAALEVDGKRYAKPMSLKVEAGSHQIRLQRNGRWSAHEVNLEEGEQKAWRCPGDQTE